MARRHTRRSALIRLGLGSAGLVVAPSIRAGKTVAATASATSLADRIRACGADEVYDVAAAALAAGADAPTLLGAGFLAGVQDIRPHGVGGKFHAVLMVESAYQLAERSSRIDRFRVAMWALWDFKRCQQRDRDEEGDWVLPPRPDVSFPSEAAARRELCAAMDDWNVARADRAVVGLLGYHDQATLFELLWPYGVRCYADLGHKIIYTAHADRTLRRVGWEHAEPVLRSLVRGLLYTTDDGRRTESYDSARGLVARFPATWLDGKVAPDASLALLRALRGKSPAAAQRAVVDASHAGAGVASIWDGLRLRATEIFYCRAAGGERRHVPVHPITELNAFGHVWRSTDDPTLRKTVLLQVAGWLALLEADLNRIVGTQRERTIDALGAASKDSAPDLIEVFERPSETTALAAIDGTIDGDRRYLELLRTCLYERADQDHQHKYVAALHEEAAAIHPRFRSRMLAPAITYAPTGRDPRTPMRARSDAALKRAGVT